MEAGKKRNIAHRIGNCSNIGRQPPIGLIPARLYSSICACCFFIASSCLGYFSFSLSISGLMACILADEEYDLKVNGDTTILMKMVINKMMIPKLAMYRCRKSKSGMMTNRVNQPTSQPPSGMVFSYFWP